MIKPAFDTFEHFLNMGGYAFYVWIAYFAAALSLLTLFIYIYVQNSVTKKTVLQQAQFSKPTPTIDNHDSTSC